MNRPQFLITAVTAAIFMLLGACSFGDSDADLPEANERNCNSNLVEIIPNTTQRKKFIDLCARRNMFKPSPPKTW